MRKKHVMICHDTHLVPYINLHQQLQAKKSSPLEPITTYNNITYMVTYCKNNSLTINIRQRGYRAVLFCSLVAANNQGEIKQITPKVYQNIYHSKQQFIEEKSHLSNIHLITRHTFQEKMPIKNSQGGKKRRKIRYTQHFPS